MTLPITLSAPQPAMDAWAHGRSGLAILDAELRLRDVNPALVEQLGGARRLPGEPLTVLDAAPPTLTDAAKRWTKE